MTFEEFCKQKFNETLEEYQRARTNSREEVSHARRWPIVMGELDRDLRFFESLFREYKAQKQKESKA